jgi:hypothetical protein
MKNTLLTLFATAGIALAVGASPAPTSNGNVSATGDYVRSNGARMVINAIKHKNGTTTGGMWFQSATGQVIIVAVDDLLVIDNSAYIHGIVVVSDQNPALVGRHSYHRVVDNGEGKGSEPDRTAAFANLLNPPADPIAFLSSTTPIIEGNIQVRGG